MDPVEFQKKLDKMDQEELQDFLEAVWREEVELTPEQELALEMHLKELKRKKVLIYIVVWLVLLALLNAVPEYQGPIRRIFDNLPPVDPKDTIPFEIVWFTKEDERVCPICKPLHGKIWGKDIVEIPQLHPGCRCKLIKVKAEDVENIRTLTAGAVRAISEGQKRILEVLAAPFGSPERKDKLGQFLSKRTDYMIEIGDRRPLLYFHGFTPRAKAMRQPYSMGVATAHKIDEEGLWMRAELGDDELADRTWKAALEGNARASTGSVNYLERHDEKTGEVLCWPIAELSVFDGGDERVPVSDDAVVLPLRALFDQHGITLPDGFEAGEDKKDREDKQTLTNRSNQMNDEIKAAVDAALAEREAEEKAKQAERDAMRAEILEELKSEPKYRSTFNINRIDDRQARKDADDEEEFAFVRGLIEDARIVADGGIPRRAATILEETEADELGDVVPDQLLNKIFPLLQEYSIVDYLASIGRMTIYQAERLTFSAPQNTASPGALPDIAEAGAYTQDVPTFDAKQATMQKVGSYISVSEEALDDQTLFQSWLPGEVARIVGLSKNADLYALTNAVAGTDLATRSTFTDAEILACYYGLPQQYRSDAVWIMNDASLADIRALLVATPRAYGEIGFMNLQMGEQGETFMGKPIVANANWEDVTGADAADKVVDFLSMDNAIFWAERKAMSIFVDPYSTRIASGSINFLPMARYGGVVKNSAAMSGIDGKDA